MLMISSHSPLSKCGTYNPQSCLFSQICNVCSVLGNDRCVLDRLVQV